jgi:hypothetical protein
MSIWAPKQSFTPVAHCTLGAKPKCTPRSVFPSLPLASNTANAGSRPTVSRVALTALPLGVSAPGERLVARLPALLFS